MSLMFGVVIVRKGGYVADGVLVGAHDEVGDACIQEGVLPKSATQFSCSSCERCSHRVRSSW